MRQTFTKLFDLKRKLFCVCRDKQTVAEIFFLHFHKLPQKIERVSDKAEKRAIIF
jgi:hypothetical protein